MKVLDNIMEGLRSEMHHMTFSAILYQSRDRLGILQYKMSEFLGMRNGRLKNLENGYFRAMPMDEELDAMSKFFEIPREMLEDKAAEQVMIIRRKIKTSTNDDD